MNTFQWVAFAVVLVVSAARLTRLLTFDKFPPIRAIREWYADRTDGTDWQLLAYCPYCMSFWVTFGLVVWADLAGVLDGDPAFGWTGDLSIPLWWIGNGIFAASYAAAMTMVRDGDDD